MKRTGRSAKTNPETLLSRTVALVCKPLMLAMFKHAAENQRDVSVRHLFDADGGVRQ